MGDVVPTLEVPVQDGNEVVSRASSPPAGLGATEGLLAPVCPTGDVTRARVLKALETEASCACDRRL